MTEAEDPTTGTSTRERLLAAGLRLFAERGFTAVTVGEIEQAVGLAPRRGALYRHFASKDALLEAAVRDHLGSVAATREQFVQRPGADIHADATALARGVLAELDRQYAITQVLEREGDRLPALRESFWREVSEPSYGLMADILQTWVRDRTGGRDVPSDASGLAVHLLGGLVNARRSTWTFGRPPAGLDDEHIARSWADLCTRLVQALCGTAPPGSSASSGDPIAT